MKYFLLYTVLSNCSLNNEQPFRPNLLIFTCAALLCLSIFHVYNPKTRCTLFSTHAHICVRYLVLLLVQLLYCPHQYKILSAICPTCLHIYKYTVYMYTVKKKKNLNILK